MKIPVTLRVVALAILATAFYTWVGQLVPQKEVQPPEVVEMSEDLTTADLVEIGREIYEGKGTCQTCHGSTSRFPDLDGIATRAASRIPGMGQLEYLAQSLYEPDAFIVEGYTSGMPAMDKPPIGLSDDEIKAVIAYLQTLGGEATVTLAMQLPYGQGAEVTTDVDPEGGEDVAGIGPDTGGTPTTPMQAGATGSLQLLERYGCTNCHHVERTGRLEAVSLHDVGRRLDTAEILRNLTQHEPPLDAAYTSRVTLAEVQTMTEYLSSLQGASGGTGDASNGGDDGEGGQG